MRKKLIFAIFALVILITILCVIPIGALKGFLKGHFVQLEKARLWLEDVLHVPITFQLVQNALHIPFFGLLSFFIISYLHINNIKTRIAVTILAVLGLSFATEFVQFFIGRDASLGDVALDLIGAIAGVVIRLKREYATVGGRG